MSCHHNSRRGERDNNKDPEEDGGDDDEQGQDDHHLNHSGFRLELAIRYSLHKRLRVLVYKRISE